MSETQITVLLQMLEIKELLRSEAYLAPEGDSYPVAWNNIANEAMKNLFGFTPFEYAGKKYIAFLKMFNAARSWVTIIEDSGDFKADLETFVKTGSNIVYQAAVQIDKEGPSEEVVPSPTWTDQTSGNCAVIVKEDGAYIMGHHHNVGLSLFKMVFV